MLRGSAGSTGAQSYLVVLTATVTPAESARVKRNDPEVRRQDYATALRFWLSHPDPRLGRILFLENSGDDLGYFERIVQAENVLGKEVEFISAEPSVIPEGLSFGWAELRMLDEGLDRSNLLRKSSHIIKVTGRLVFPDISRLLDRTPGDCDAMTECRIATIAFRKGLTLIPALISRKSAYASTQLLILSRSFYEDRIRGIHTTMRPGPRSETFESVLYEQLKAAKRDQKVHFRFPVNCEPEGISGTSNRSYRSTQRRLVAFARAALRGTGIWI